MSVDGVAPHPEWAERAAERSPLVQRSRSRSIEQAQVVVDAARQLIVRQGEFTTQELVKEAGVALQTFYRHFGSKDLLLLAVIEDTVGEQAAHMETLASDITDPVARLHFYITGPVGLLAADDARVGARAITAEHWRLHQLFPEEVANATRPFVDLLSRTLVDAQAKGLLAPIDVDHDAWLMVELVRSVFHHYAFAEPDRPLDEVAERVWVFCMRAVGGDLPASTDRLSAMP